VVGSTVVVAAAFMVAAVGTGKPHLFSRCAFSF
jgi:hypothetical protein